MDSVSRQAAAARMGAVALVWLCGRVFALRAVDGRIVVRQVR